MSFLDWLAAICKDADPVKPGFQAQGIYLLLCVTGPVVFGATVALLMTALERIFGIKLSKGGH